MKRLIAIFVLVPWLCFAGTKMVYDQQNGTSAKVTSSSSVKTSVDFSLKGLTTETVTYEDKEYTKVLPLQEEIADWGFLAEEGLPDLPVYSSLMIIPDEAAIQINIISSEYETYQGIDVAPAQAFALESGEQEINFALDRDFYQQDAFYPQELVTVNEPMIIRDFRFAQVVVHPVQYNPVTKEMRVYTSINYELNYDGYDNRNVKTRRDNRISEAFLPIYENIFDNAEEVLTDYEAVKGGYLIITPNNLNFPDTIATLARWKHLKGYYTKVVQSDEIDAAGTPTYSEVAAYIEDAYNNWEIPPDYVLLVGDENLRIPQYPYSGYASDHQYTTVDGDDYFADILLARMPADNLAELKVIMHKILSYEQTPNMTDTAYYKRGLGVAGNIYATSPRITNLWVRELALDHGYTQVDTCFDWGSGAPNYEVISEAINDGVSYVSYRGWAGPSGWYNPSWGVSNVSSLTNGYDMGIMASIVCGTGDFSTDDCLGEAWTCYGTVTVPKGGPCFYGCTDHSTHTAWNNPNMVGFFWALFEQDMYNFTQLMYMGKFRIYESFPTYTGSDGYVNKYFNTYNSLGDPQLEVRTAVPQTMTVTHPSSIIAGTNYLAVTVTDADGSPFEGAYANLVKGFDDDEEIYEGEYIDASGQVTFDFAENTSSDTIFVTVTARDYIPYQGYCLVTTPTVSLGVDSVIVADGTGNSDGLINAGERTGLSITLHNYGSSVTATNITATLTSPDDRVSIITGTQSYPNIAYGNGANPNSNFVVEIADDVAHGDHIPLNLAISSTQGSWSAIAALDVVSLKAGDLTVSYPDISGDVINPGQSANMVVEFTNAGGLSGTQISGQLTCSDEYVSISDSYGYFGAIASGATGDNSDNPFRITISDEAYNGRNINFTINFTENNTSIGEINFTRTFSIAVGTINSFDPIGPDNYGYYIYDSSDLGYSPAPIYDWIEINPNLGGNGSELDVAADDGSALVALPFIINYYGEEYGHMIISTNGFVAFDTIPFDVAGEYWNNWDNWPIPDYGNARAQISPFWDDLEYSGSSNGIFTYYDNTNDLFIVEWSGCDHARTGATETFQIIFYDADTYPTPTGDCEIVFQYLNVVNNDFNDDYTGPEMYSSVGFENWEQNDGLQYEFDNIYADGAIELQNGLALKITTATGLAEPPNMSYSPDEFTVSSESGDQATRYIYITNSGAGYLYYDIDIDTDDTNLASADQTAKQNNNSEQPVITQAKGENGPIYPPVTLESGGPDDYGYSWIDSDESDGPTYNWIDISSIGTEITWPSDSDDGIVTGIQIGFDFPFYGNDYSIVNASTNGFISFTSTVTAYSNVGIPTADDPNNMLAMYWDDMNFESGGSAYYYSNDVDTFIVSYIDLPHYDADGAFTFQAILLASGKIIFQYQEATGSSLNSETVGIENSDGTDGLQVCYNASYIEAELAIEFIASPRWLTASPATAVVYPNTSDTVIVTFDASDLEVGEYTGNIHMETNDSDYPSIDIPVTFSVIVAGDCDYTSGDINSDGQVTVADITYGVQYFKNAGSVPPDSCWNDDTNTWLYAAGDVNGNCAFMGSDISYLVKYFQSQRPTLNYCPQTPPTSTTESNNSRTTNKAATTE